jgi:hypothetical protein
MKYNFGEDRKLNCEFIILILRDHGNLGIRMVRKSGTKVHNMFIFNNHGLKNVVDGRAVRALTIKIF